MKEAFLINAGWVPLSWDKNVVEVLVDDPRDLNKTDNIKALLNTPKINFSVAIKEDIEEFIKRFFDASQDMAEDGSTDNLDDFDLIPDVSFEEEYEVHADLPGATTSPSDVGGGAAANLSPANSPSASAAPVSSNLDGSVVGTCC